MNVTNPVFSDAFQASASVPATALFPEFFANAKATGGEIEQRAWRRIDDLYVELKDEFGDLYSDQNPTLKMTKEICQSYNCPEAVDSILSILYLKHRDRYMTVPDEFSSFADGYWPTNPQNGSDDTVKVIGFSYPGCTSEIGDIVNFNDIDPAQLARQSEYPITHLWKHLKLDHELSAEIVSYACALKIMTQCLQYALDSVSKREIPSGALHNLSHYLLAFEFEHNGVIPSIGLLIHGIILQTV